jgi:hypothetical protein
VVVIEHDPEDGTHWRALAPFTDVTGDAEQV